METSTQRLELVVTHLSPISSFPRLIVAGCTLGGYKPGMMRVVFPDGTIIQSWLEDKVAGLTLITLPSGISFYAFKQGEGMALYERN